MKLRALTSAVVVLAAVALAVGPVLAQTAITVQNPSFEWTGKSGQMAGYRWSASVDNPSGRELQVRVSFEMLDSAGAVVASDSVELTVASEDTADVERTAEVEVATAQGASQYRVTLMGIDG